MPEFNIKYRPQTISELDLTSVREGLEKVLTSPNLPHAFLFCGPRGTGKTSAARIVAKAVNCIGRSDPSFAKASEGKIFEPCNKCEQCVSITSGNNLDVLEIDAASNRGIDDIRDLREKIKLAPTKSKYKVYIIDEVHMLTIEAFNALLKTLEEPPAHAIFILCTTDWEKLPETIVSRCMRFNFKRAKKEEISQKLKKIAKEEKIDIDEKALEEIALGASGSFRDAQKILEQASFAKTKIAGEDIKKILGNALEVNPEDLLKLLAGRQTKESLAELAKVVESGANLKVYCQKMLELMRQGLLNSLGISEEGQNVGEELLKIFAQFKTSDFEKLIALFSAAGRDLKDALIAQMPLELAIISWCLGEKRGEETKVEEIREEPQEENNPVEKETGLEPDLASVAVIEHRWQEILLGVRPKNHSVEALLRATRPISYIEETLTLEVFYKFHKDQLETEKCRSIVEEVTSHLIGKPVKLKCVLGERPKKTVVAEMTPKEIEVKEITQEDLVKVAEEIFSGRIN